MNTRCSRCKAVLAPDMRFCEQCGLAVPAVPAPVLAAESTPLALPDIDTTAKRNRGAGLVVTICLAAAVGGGWWAWNHRAPVASGETRAVETNVAPKPNPARAAVSLQPRVNEKPVEQAGVADPVRASELPAAAAPPKPVMKQHSTEKARDGAVPENTVPENTAPAITPRLVPPVQAKARAAPVPDSTSPAVEARPEPPMKETPAQKAPVPASESEPPRVATPPAPVVPEKSADAAAVPAPYHGPLAGAFDYTGPPVIQNGEVVFEGLPPVPLKLTYDTKAWDARVEKSEGGRQRIVMTSKKPGTQKKCAVRWSAE